MGVKKARTQGKRIPKGHYLAMRVDKSEFTDAVLVAHARGLLTRRGRQPRGVGNVLRLMSLPDVRSEADRLRGVMQEMSVES